jgi:hypothetical protein
MIHYLINFFKSTLTVPKIKDLVNKPTQKYEDIYNIINSQQNNYEDNLIPILKEEVTEKIMKNELKDFLKKQLTDTAPIY